MKRIHRKLIGGLLMAALASTASARFTYLFRKVPNDWVRFEGRGFSMMVPPGLVRSDIQGEDSLLIRLVGPKMQIDISEGMYAGHLSDPLPAWQNYQAEPIGVCMSNKGRLISFTNAEPLPDGKRYAAIVVCPEIGKVGRDRIGLNVNTYSLSTEDRGWAVTALRSIRLPTPNDEKRRKGTIDAR